MSENQTLSEITKTYRLLDDNFSRLYGECKNEQERNTLIACRDGARDAFWRATASDLKDRGTLVLKFTADLKKTNAEIEKTLKSLQEIVSFIDRATEAVKLAASLAVLASAV